jgi:DNA-binding MarR family transcriptional regulator
MAGARGTTLETTHLIRDSCLCLHVQRAARVLARRFDDALRPVGLTNGQFSLLLSLNRPKPPGMTAVASLLAMDRTTVTAALKPLQRRGLVRITLDPEDRRGRLMVLTPKGRRLLARAVPIWKKSHAIVEALVRDAERLRNDLRALSWSQIEISDSTHLFSSSFPLQEQMPSRFSRIGFHNGISLDARVGDELFARNSRTAKIEIRI